MRFLQNHVSVSGSYSPQAEHDRGQTRALPSDKYLSAPLTLDRAGPGQRDLRVYRDNTPMVELETEFATENIWGKF